VAGAIIRKPWFDARPVHVRFVVDKGYCDRVFSEYFRFLLSVSFHKCYELTYTSGLHLSEGNSGVVRRSYKRSSSFSNIREHRTGKYRTVILVKGLVIIIIIIIGATRFSE
jgi:hypothetical protein